MDERNRGRRYLRIRPEIPIHADMTIVQVGNRKVGTGTARVRVSDISPGGLRFISSLNLPADKSVLIELKFRLAEQDFRLKGHIAHKCGTEVCQYEYGFCFVECNDTLRACLKRLFNNMTVKMRRQIVILRFNRSV